MRNCRRPSLCQRSLDSSSAVFQHSTKRRLRFLRRPSRSKSREMSDSESQPLLSERTASVPLGSRVIVERQGDILRLAVPARGLRQGGGGILGFGLFWCLAIGAIAGVMTWAGALAQPDAP